MKKFVIAVLTLVFLVLPAAPANAARGCIIDVLGVRVCGELLNQPLPEVIEVTVRPDPIRVTETVRVPVPGPPGPTRTVTAPAQPNATVTVTSGPVVQNETVTRTPVPSQPRPSTLPGQDVTTTVSPSGQESVRYVTLEPDVVTKPVPFKEERTVLKTIKQGALFSVIFGILGAVALFVGYRMGFGAGRNASAEQEGNWLTKILSPNT